MPNLHDVMRAPTSVCGCTDGSYAWIIPAAYFRRLTVGVVADTGLAQDPGGWARLPYVVADEFQETLHNSHLNILTRSLFAIKYIA